jgi:hypothetical protein
MCSGKAPFSQIVKSEGRMNRMNLIFSGVRAKKSRRLGNKGLQTGCETGWHNVNIPLTHETAHRIVPPRGSEFLSKSNNQ